MTEMVVLAVVFGNGMIAENVVGEVQDMPYAGFGGFVGVGVAGDVEFQVEPVDFECADLVLVCRIQTTKADSVSKIPHRVKGMQVTYNNEYFFPLPLPHPPINTITHIQRVRTVFHKGILGYEHVQ